jgi:predicted transcriptional regulator
MAGSLHPIEPTVTTAGLLSRFSWRSRTRDWPEAAGRVYGPLEMSVMDILWTSGESSVRDVIRQLDRPLAYTTVMTTLDRLFKKGLLDRRKANRAFLYSPRLSQPNWQRRIAGELVDGFLSGPALSSELLLSCLVDAVGQRDEALLDELEKRIQQRRKELLIQSKHHV